MSELKYPLLASFAGKIVYAISSISMLPLVTGMLGRESVGLLGFFTSLLMVMMAMDGGLTSAIVRDLARIKRPIGRSVTRYLRYKYSLINTYLMFFCCIGAAAVLFLAGVSNFLSSNWLSFEELSSAQVQESILWMALFIGLNFPILILQGALVGSEQQVRMNVIYIQYALLRTFGVLVVLYYSGENASVELFFSLQVLVQFIYLVSLAIAVFYEGGRLFLGSPPRWRLLCRGFQFSCGVMLISLTSVVVVQFDKVYLSGQLVLETYAIYALAGTFAGVPYIISAALQAVLFPRFSRNVVAGDHKGNEHIFRGYLSVFGLILVAASCAAWSFSVYPLTLFFDIELAAQIAQIVPILLMGTCLQSLLIIPYTLQLAIGWTSLSLRLNLCLIPLIVVGMPLMAGTYAMVGVAWIWFFYNLLLFSFTFYFVSRRFSFLVPALVELIKISVVYVVFSLPVFMMLLSWVVPYVSNTAAVMIQIFAVSALLILVTVLFRRDILRRLRA